MIYAMLQMKILQHTCVCNIFILSPITITLPLSNGNEFIGVDYPIHKLMGLVNQWPDKTLIT